MEAYQEFQETVWQHYREHGRDLPWRHEPFEAYRILVSELMLQQTQVARVIPKYHQFLLVFPTMDSLAEAPLGTVIRAWSGLGYNRRAKYLHEAAKHLQNIEQPWLIDDLTGCKGVGYNTAAAVLTYAYNQPHPFIETNVRTVYIHHFFAGMEQVADKELLPLIKETLDNEHPREFMWAIMDYGSFLKTSVGNLSRYSKHHTVQSRFEGSRRQIRGQVLRALHANPITKSDLQALISDDRLAEVLQELERDGLILRQAGMYQLAN